MFKYIAKILTTIVYLGYIFFLLFFIYDVKMREDIVTGYKNVQQFDTLVRLTNGDGKSTSDFIKDYQRNYNQINEQYNIQNIMYMIKDINIFATSDDFIVDEHNSVNDDYQSLYAYTVNNQYLNTYPIHIFPFKSINSLGSDEIIIPRRYKKLYPIGSTVNIANSNIEGKGIVTKDYTVVGYTNIFSNIISVNDYALPISLHDKFVVPLPELNNIRTSPLVNDYYNDIYNLGAFINTDEQFLANLDNDISVIDTTGYFDGIINDLHNYMKKAVPIYLILIAISSACLLFVSYLNIMSQKEKYAFYIYHGISVKKLLIMQLKPNILVSFYIFFIAMLIDYVIVPMYIQNYYPFSLIAFLLAFILLLLTMFLFDLVNFKTLIKKPTEILPKEKL